MDKKIALLVLLLVASVLLSGCIRKYNVQMVN